MDLDRVIDGARRPQRTVRLCLRGDLAAKVADAEEELRKARRSRSSLGQKDVAAAQAAYDQAVEQAREHTVTLTLTGPSRWRLRQIITQNPPRDGDEDDARAGYDRDAYVWHLLRDALTDPVLSDDQFAALFGDADRLGDGVVSSGQWQAIDDALTEVAYGGASVPF